MCACRLYEIGTRPLPVSHVPFHDSYLANAKKVSHKLRDYAQLAGTGDWQGLPMQQTARWIEYAMEHGTSHLRRREEDFAWYQNCLLDVAFVVVGSTLTFVWLVRKSCCRRRHRV